MFHLSRPKQKGKSTSKCECERDCNQQGDRGMLIVQDTAIRARISITSFSARAVAEEPCRIHCDMPAEGENDIAHRLCLVKGPGWSSLASQFAHARLNHMNDE